MPPRNTRNSQKGESKIPSLAQSSLPIPNSNKTSKLSLPESRKRRDSLSKAVASEIVNPVNIKFGANNAKTSDTSGSGSVASDASAIQTKSSLLTAALTRTSKKVESPKPKLRSKKNTPIKEALKNASGKNTPNKTRLAKEKETPKKSTTGSSTAEINYIDLSDDDEDFGEPIVKPEPVLQAPAASKPLAPSNLTQPKIQSTFLKSSKAETKPLTSKVTDSPKQKDVKRASGKGDEESKKQPTSLGNDIKKQSNVDWKARYEETKKLLEEKEGTIKQLDVKIPNMIQEFQKCITNKDSLIEIRDREKKEITAVLESKEKIISELTSGSTAIQMKMDQVSKEKNNLNQKYSYLKSDFDKKENELKSVINMNYELKQKNEKLVKDLESHLKLKDKEIDKFKSQLVTKDDSIKKLEVMKTKIRSDLDKYIATDHKIKSENSRLKEGIKDLMKAMESKESSTKSDLSKLKADLEKMTQDRDNKALKISLVEADLNLHVQELEGARREIQSQSSLLQKKDLELKSAKEATSNLSQVKSSMNKLMQESEKKAKIIEHQNLVIKKFKTQSEDFCKKLNIAEDLRKQFIDLKAAKTTVDAMLKKQAQELLLVKNNLQKREEEVHHMKTNAEKLEAQVKELESNKRDTVEQLTTQLDTMKQLQKRSIQCVSLMKATQEYKKMLDERQLQHTSHMNCSQSPKRIVKNILNTVLDHVDGIINAPIVHETSDAEVQIEDAEVQIEDPEEVIDVSSSGDEDGEDDDVLEYEVINLEEVENDPHTSGQKIINLTYCDYMLQYLWPVALLPDQTYSQNNANARNTKRSNSIKISEPLKRKLEEIDDSSRKKRRILADQDDDKPPVTNFNVLYFQTRKMDENFENIETENQATGLHSCHDAESTHAAMPYPMISYNWPVSLRYFDARKRFHLDSIDFPSILSLFINASYRKIDAYIEEAEINQELYGLDRIFVGLDVSFPNNMLGYDWPVALRSMLVLEMNSINFPSILSMMLRGPIVDALASCGSLKEDMDSESTFPAGTRPNPHEVSLQYCVQFPNNMLTYDWPIEVRPVTPSFTLTHINYPSVLSRLLWQQICNPDSIVTLDQENPEDFHIVHVHNETIDFVFPNNMITYSWPLVPAFRVSNNNSLNEKNSHFERSSIKRSNTDAFTDKINEKKMRISSDAVVPSDQSIMGTRILKCEMLSCSESMSPMKGTKRNRDTSLDEDTILNDQKKPRLESGQALCYDWPVAVYQKRALVFEEVTVQFIEPKPSNIVRKPVKRPRKLVIAELPPAKRFKLDHGDFEISPVHQPLFEAQLLMPRRLPNGPLVITINKFLPPDDDKNKFDQPSHVTQCNDSASRLNSAPRKLELTYNWPLLPFVLSHYSVIKSSTSTSEDAESGSNSTIMCKDIVTEICSNVLEVSSSTFDVAVFPVNDTVESFVEKPENSIICKDLVAEILSDLPLVNKSEDDGSESFNEIEVDSNWEALYLQKEVDDMFHQEPSKADLHSKNEVQTACYQIMNELIALSVDQSTMRMCSNIVNETLDSILSEISKPDETSFHNEMNSSPTSVKLILKALDNLYS